MHPAPAKFFLGPSDRVAALAVLCIWASALVLIGMSARLIVIT